MSGFEPVFFLFCRHFSLFPAVLPASDALFPPQTMFVGAANAFSPLTSAINPPDCDFLLTKNTPNSTSARSLLGLW